MALNDSLNGTNASTTQAATNGYNYVEEPPQLVTFRRVIFSFILILAFFGNIIVIRAIRTKRRSRKPLTHYLVTSLAVAEILNSFSLMFYFVQEEVHHWPFGSFLCHIIVPSILITFSATTATLVCISLYRYRVLVTPYKKTPSKRVCLIILAVIWGYSTAFTIPVILTTKINPYPPGLSLCYPNPPLPTYELVRLICQFFVPAIVMCISYSAASCKIREHMTFIEAGRQIRINSNLSTLHTYLDSQGGNGCDNNFLTVPINQPIIHLQNMAPRDSICNGRRSVEITAMPQLSMDRSASVSVGDEESHMIETERDIIKMFYVIVLVFLVCYIPYQICFLLDHFVVVTQDHPYYLIIRNYVFLLTTFPSALHPLCYGTMSSFYASAFSKIILCKCK